MTFSTTLTTVGPQTLTSDPVNLQDPSWAPHPDPQEPTLTSRTPHYQHPDPQDPSMTFSTTQAPP